MRKILPGILPGEPNAEEPSTKLKVALNSSIYQSFCLILKNRAERALGLSFESNFQIIFRTHPKCCVGCDEYDETEELTSQVGDEVCHDVCCEFQ